ncbi:MAG: ATP-binding protein, partial [Aestuariivirga sp.]
YQSPYGTREARINLRRKAEANSIYAFAVMDDVTERRELERQMAQAPAPTKPTETLAPAEQQVFENLGKAISKAAGPAPSQQPKAPSLAPAAREVPLLKPVALPQPLLIALQKTTSAVAIVHEGQPLFANQRLTQLLGHADVTSLLNDAAFWSVLQNAPQRLGRLKLPNANGQHSEFVVSRHNMPWKSGAADQFTFEPLLTDHHLEIPTAIKTAPVETAPAAPQPARASTTSGSAANDELRAILDICADGIVTLDASGLIKNFSAGAEAIFGFRSAEVIGKPFSLVLDENSASVFDEYLGGLSGRGLASVFNDGREVMGVVKQGGQVPLFMTLGRISSEGKSPAYCAVLRDITAFKRSEAELRAAKDAAESASRHKSEFLARVSHELRTPLNAIMGFSDMMRSGRYGEIGNERYRGYLNDIHNSSTHLLSMINDLLDLSKIESGKLELNFTAVSIVDCFNEAQRLLQDQATRARVVIRKSFTSDLPRVVADQQALKQVLVNLLSNAIKYTDAGGQVVASARLDGYGALALSLQDTGIGMGKTELDKALKPFMRVETPGRDRPGTGLGLPLTKALVEANRANFNVTSEPGKGTRVEITFPTTRVLAE